MPDQLQSIVQRMIDAGENEENIATVIQHFKAQAPPPLGMSVIEAGRRSAMSGDTETPPEQTFTGGLGAAMGPVAHPQSGMDIARLLTISPTNGMAAGARAAQPYVSKGLRAGGVALERAGTAAQPAGDILGAAKVFQHDPLVGGAIIAGPRVAQGVGRLMQRTGAALEPAAAATYLDRSIPVKAGALTQEQLAERVFAGHGTPTKPAGPYMPTPQPGSVTPIEPVPSHAVGKAAQDIAGGKAIPKPAPGPASTVQDLATKMGHGVDAEQAALDLQLQAENAARLANRNTEVPALAQARRDIGAQRVGRAQGMTKEAVRQEAGPVLDEAIGEASPVLPEKVLQTIIDKMKSLPKGGPEREAYVQAATSGKTKAQVENIRRTLEHLGLLVPVGVGAAAMRRQALLSAMPEGQQY